MENPALISLKNVSCHFGKTAGLPAIDRLSLDIYAGEIL
ncbi:MAG: methionine ABC transporter ATP-binding protein, partial [Bartonella sp.]|nr:methionine ABC transporter ATP-binding protein [Bartonella sp.]